MYGFLALVAELPDECIGYLLGSRYCETDRLNQAAWDLSQNVAHGMGPHGGV